jgi:hypothetical protein
MSQCSLLQSLPTELIFKIFFFAVKDLDLLRLENISQGFQTNLFNPMLFKYLDLSDTDTTDESFEVLIRKS